MTFIQASKLQFQHKFIVILCPFCGLIDFKSMFYYTAILRKLWHLTFENYMPTGQVKSLCLGLRCFTPKLEVHTDQAVSLCVY